MSEAQKVTPASTRFSRPRLGFVVAYLAVCSVLIGFYHQVNIDDGTQFDFGQTLIDPSLYLTMAVVCLALLINLTPLIFLYVATINNFLIYIAGVLVAFTSSAFVHYSSRLQDFTSWSDNFDDDLRAFHPVVLSYSLLMLLYLLAKSSDSRLFSRLGNIVERHKSVALRDHLLFVRKVFILITVTSTAILASRYSQLNQHPEAAYEGEYPNPFLSLLEALTTHLTVFVVLQSPFLYIYLVVFTNRMATYLGGIALFIGNMLTSIVHYVDIDRSHIYYLMNAPIIWTLLVPTSLGLIYGLTIAWNRSKRPQITFANSEKLNLSIPPPPR